MILPEGFIKTTAPLMGSQRWQRFRDSLAEERPVSIHLNPTKATHMNIHPAILDAQVPWCPNGYYLKQRPAFTFDPLWHAGLYYVQEAASMFISEVIRQHITQPVTALDLCAAPGGKSLLLRETLPQDSLLFSNEPMRHRANILVENIQKQGHPDVIVTNNYAKDYRKAGLLFDVILTDMPCSGEGMFRKEPEAVQQWSTQLTDQCAQLQREILDDIWPCLRQGGILIYSTCTFNPKENEENIRYILDHYDAEILSVEVSGAWGITPSLSEQLPHPVYRFIPGSTRSEGLFMAVVRKTGGEEVTRKKDKKHHKTEKRKTDAPRWIEHQEDYLMQWKEEQLIAVSKRWADIYQLAEQNLRVLHAGIPMATVKGKDLIPSHALALSTALCREAFPHIDVDILTALQYLRKETITLPPDMPKGFVLITYRQHPIGFVKNLGNRTNNLYPMEWKIKSGHLPETLPIVVE